MTITLLFSSSSHAVSLFHYTGLAAGYNAVAPAAQKLPWLAFGILNAVGDLLDLQKYDFVFPPPPSLNILYTSTSYTRSFTIHSLTHSLTRSLTPSSHFSALSGKSVWARFRPNDDWIYNSHCSALIKVTGNLQDLFAGHTSWYSLFHKKQLKLKNTLRFVYGAMLRIAKDYNFPLHNPLTASQRYNNLSLFSYTFFSSQCLTITTGWYLARIQDSWNPSMISILPAGWTFSPIRF